MAIALKQGLTEQPKTIDLRVERLNRTILVLSVPSVTESMLTTMIYMVDTILIGWLNDPVALAAVVLSGTLMWASDGLFRAISISASRLVRAISRHIVGSDEAIRVKSRNPPAEYSRIFSL